MLDDDTTTMLDLVSDGAGPQSLQDRLRAQRQTIAETHETFIFIPGYEEAGLQAKYRLLDRDDVKSIAKNIEKGNKRIDRADFQMLVIQDTIINALEGFFTQESGQEEPVPLLESDEEGAQQITNWIALSKFMDPEGVGRDRQRTALQFCFADNDFAVGQHGITLQRWMANTNIQVNEMFLGEAG